MKAKIAALIAAPKKRRSGNPRPVNRTPPPAKRSNKPRCPCGAHTMHRAQARAFDCCKRAGVIPRK